MKATKTEIAERVEEVLRIRLDGAQFHDIVQYSSQKGWAVGERQLWKYVAASDALLTKRLEKDRDKLFARHVAQRRMLFARAVNGADYRTALAVVKDEAELQGLYPSGKLEATGKDGGAMQIRLIEVVRAAGPTVLAEPETPAESKASAEHEDDHPHAMIEIVR